MSTEYQKQIDLLPTNILIQGYQITRKVFINGSFLDPKPSQKVWNHSPDGFNWGYAGSGCAQLALGILLKYLPADLASALHQDFKFNTVANWNRDDIVERINLHEEVKKILDKRPELLERIN